ILSVCADAPAMRQVSNKSTNATTLSCFIPILFLFMNLSGHKGPFGEQRKKGPEGSSRTVQYTGSAPPDYHSSWMIENVAGEPRHGESFLFRFLITRY
ncbi:MAG TPA: hypothetical protein PK955_10405, partial [Methanoregulaceae archaeon]|nr:hypothetical protein [Methanoregulaceae archaeon]